MDGSSSSCATSRCHSCASGWRSSPATSRSRAPPAKASECRSDAANAHGRSSWTPATAHRTVSMTPGGASKANAVSWRSAYRVAYGTPTAAIQRSARRRGRRAGAKPARQLEAHQPPGQRGTDRRGPVDVGEGGRGDGSDLKRVRRTAARALGRRLRAGRNRREEYGREDERRDDRKDEHDGRAVQPAGQAPGREGQEREEGRDGRRPFGQHPEAKGERAVAALQPDQRPGCGGRKERRAEQAGRPAHEPVRAGGREPGDDVGQEEGISPAVAHVVARVGERHSTGAREQAHEHRPSRDPRTAWTAKVSALTARDGHTRRGPNVVHRAPPLRLVERVHRRRPRRNGAGAHSAAGPTRCLRHVSPRTAPSTSVGTTVSTR